MSGSDDASEHAPGGEGEFEPPAQQGEDLVGARWTWSWPWSLDWTLTVLGTVLLVVGLLATAAGLLVWRDATVSLLGAPISAWVVGATVLVVGLVVVGAAKLFAPPAIDLRDRDHFEERAYRVFQLGLLWNLARFAGLGLLLAGGYIWYHLGFVAPEAGVLVDVGRTTLAGRSVAGGAAVLGAGLILAAQVAKVVRSRMRDKVLLAYHEREVRRLAGQRSDED